MAALSERSQRGDRDSELAAVIRDTDMIEGYLSIFILEASLDMPQDYGRPAVQSGQICSHFESAPHARASWG